MRGGFGLDQCQFACGLLAMLRGGRSGRLNSLVSSARGAAPRAQVGIGRAARSCSARHAGADGAVQIVGAAYCCLRFAVQRQEAFGLAWCGDVPRDHRWLAAAVAERAAERRLQGGDAGRGGGLGGVQIWTAWRSRAGVRQIACGLGLVRGLALRRGLCSAPRPRPPHPGPLPEREGDGSGCYYAFGPVGDAAGWVGGGRFQFLAG